MGRKALPLGPASLSLIEDASIDLVRAVLTLRGSENEADFQLPPPAPTESDEACRQEFLTILRRFDREALHPLEQRCQRIRRLAEGKGVASLDTIVGQLLKQEQQEKYSDQPDSLCRSIWTYINLPRVFQDAESFHFARQFRDYGKLYDAFEVELESNAPIDSTSVDADTLAAKITDFLDLKTKCTVRALDLPPTKGHPASIMLIVRHGGPLSSVFHHGEDGRRDTIYFRPPNEATLIYTPSTQQIEVCADSPVVRQKVGASFAAVVLRHDISKKPLTWKQYNLSRFRSELTLPSPELAGFEVLAAKLVEVELRLGSWTRKLSLRVTIDDDIGIAATRYLVSNIFDLADSFSRVCIAIRYRPVGDARDRTLNVVVSSNSCNLQSNKDPEQRGLGYALLVAWEIMTPFKQIQGEDLRAMLPQLVRLFDRGEEQVTGAFLQEVGLDPTRLLEGGLIERRGRQHKVLMDNFDGEISVSATEAPNVVHLSGPFGEDAGEHSANEFDIYHLNSQWLHETLVGIFRPLLSQRSAHVVDADLTLVGTIKIDGTPVPVYLARRLDSQKTINRLDLRLRATNSAGAGIILATGSNLPSCLGPNVVAPLLQHLSTDEGGAVLLRESIELAFRYGRNLALGGSTPMVQRSAAQSGTLYVPGKSPLSLIGEYQLALFERLVAGYRAGTPDVKASTLTAGARSRSPQQCFRTETWKSILGVYITKGIRKGYWRLVV